MGPVDPRNQNTNALTFAPAEQASTKFQVNLNSDGTFKDFKTEATDPKITNIIRGWASMFQAKVDAGDKLSYVSEKEVRFVTLGRGGVKSLKKHLVSNLMRAYASIYYSKAFKVNAMLSILFHQPHFISLLFTSKIAKNDQ